jgi:hypothetical protein
MDTAVNILEPEILLDMAAAGKSGHCLVNRAVA